MGQLPLVARFRHLGPTGPFTLMHLPPFAPGALFTTKHKVDISSVGQSLEGRPDGGLEVQTLRVFAGMSVSYFQFLSSRLITTSLSSCIVWSVQYS
jgi:hypothetical protein